MTKPPADERHLAIKVVMMHVEVEAERDGQPEKLTQADVTYVAIESTGVTRRLVPIRDE